jgi:hypothetical protein
MKISSNYYDYYSQMYQLNSLSNSQTNTDSQIGTEDSSSSKNQTKAISSIQTRSYVPDENVDIEDLNYSGTMLANSLKLQSNYSSEISENMEKLKTDMDSLKTTDIDNMSSDDAKEILTQLQTDMSSINSPDGESSDISNIDIDSMSESDMKDILKKIQDQANSMPVPPPPPSTEASNVFSKINEDVESIKTADIDNMSADDAKEILTQLQNDMSSIKNPYGGSSSSQKMDIDSMTESDIKNMLKKIQEHANKMSMMGGFKPSETSNGIAENQNSTSSIDSDIGNEIVSQQTNDNMTE